MINDFLRSSLAEKGLSAATLEAYKRDLIDAQKWIDRNYQITLQQINSEYLTNYVAHLNDLHSARTVARHMSALRQYYKWLTRYNAEQINPMKKLRSPRIPVLVPHFVSENDVSCLIDTWHASDEPEHKRFIAIVELLYGSGLRVSEAVEMPLKNIQVHGDDPFILVKGKGQKERLVPMSPPALHALKRYLDIRPLYLEGSKSHAFLFPSRGQYHHLTRQGFGKALRKCAADTGLKGLSPHTLRHAFATHMLHRGADLLVLQKLLGHADLSTTQIYTQVLSKQIVDLLHNHHPLSRTSR